MKNILVPTDFSVPANNALEYAMQLACATHANIVLLNVCYTPLLAGDLPVAFASHEEIMHANNKRIEELRKSVEHTAKGKFGVASITWHGFAAEEIVGCASDIRASLIVMGINGSTSSSAIQVGSTTTQVINNSPIPVLTIPPAARYQSVRSILFAFDCTAEPGPRVVEQLKTYADTFHAKIEVVNIANSEEIKNAQLVFAGIRLEEQLNAVSPGLYFPYGSDVVRDLEVFICNHHSDWLVMVPHHQNIHCGLFHKLLTQNAAFEINIPLLTINEK